MRTKHLVVLALTGCTMPGSEPLPRGDAEAAAISADILLNDRPATERAVARAIDLGPRCLVPLANLLEHAEPRVTRATERALWGIVRRSTRPGAADERERASAALLQVLDRRTLPTAGAWQVFQMLALCADDPVSVQAIGRHLDDPVRASSARFALERIAHPAADQVLIRQLSAGRDRAAAAARSLGARRSAAAVPALLGAIRDGVAVDEARGALARIGDPRAEPILRRALAAGEPAAADHWIRYLELRPDGPETAAGYRLLARSADPDARLAALVGLDRVAEFERVDALLDLLGDDAPRVRAAARARLAAISDEATGQRISAAFESASPTVRAEILRVQRARGEPRVVERVRAALDATDPSLRATAVELLADVEFPGVDDTLLAAAASEFPAVRAAAEHSVCRHAERRMIRGEPESARELLHGLLGGLEGTASVDALRLLERVADARSPGVVARFAEVEGLVDEVARVRVAAAEQIKDRATAMALLEAVYDTSTDRRIRREAVRQLTALGVDTSGFASRAGFLTRWRVLGPFEAATAADFASHPFGVAGPSLASTHSVRGNQTAWRAIDTVDPDGVVDLRGFEPNTDAVAYALHDLDWPHDDADVELRIGSDDGVAVWVNGELVHAKHVRRGIEADQDVVAVRLRRGANRILLKVDQGGGDWGFCVRLATGRS